MRAIRSTNTRPEMAVRSLLHKAGYRFRVHSPLLPGRPDIVFWSRRKAVFVHGCFWHRHSGCSNAGAPRTRPEYWKAKFRQNTKRDRQNLVALARLGWRVLVVWECEVRSGDRLDLKLAKFLGSVRAAHSSPLKRPRRDETRAASVG
ncbi:MAG: DNA mismatch endonuclease Vsr [Rhodospirillaceae bacterium]|nr:DNA mismatch endonuclease Vsr [Rhodospirillaceae bacterium]